MPGVAALASQIRPAPVLFLPPTEVAEGGNGSQAAFPDAFSRLTGGREGGRGEGPGRKTSPFCSKRDLPREQEHIFGNTPNTPPHLVFVFSVARFPEQGRPFRWFPPLNDMPFLQSPPPLILDVPSPLHPQEGPSCLFLGLTINPVCHRHPRASPLLAPWLTSNPVWKPHCFLINADPR